MPHLEFQVITLNFFCLALTFHARLPRFELFNFSCQLHTPINFFFVLFFQFLRFLHFVNIDLVSSTAFFAWQTLLNGFMSWVNDNFFYLRDHFRMDVVVFFRIFVLACIWVIILKQIVIGHLRMVNFLQQLLLLIFKVIDASGEWILLLYIL